MTVPDATQTDSVRRSKRRYASLVALAGGALVFTAFIAWLLMQLAGEPLAAFPAWWSASATALAFAAAAVAAFMAYVTVERELGREERRSEDERRQQADRVAAWAGPMMWSASRPTKGLLERTPEAPANLFATNASGLPVTNVTYAVDVVARAGGRTAVRQTGSIHRDVLPPGDRPVVIDLSEPLRDAIIGAVQAFRAEGFGPEDIALTAGLAFTDVRQQHWIREPSGRLLEAPEQLWRVRQGTRL